MIKFLLNNKNVFNFLQKADFKSKDFFSISCVEKEDNIFELLLIDEKTFKTVTIENYKYEIIKYIIIIKKQD